MISQMKSRPPRKAVGGVLLRVLARKTGGVSKPSPTGKAMKSYATDLGGAACSQNAVRFVGAPHQAVV